jgi:hypothetical protein
MADDTRTRQRTTRKRDDGSRVRCARREGGVLVEIVVARLAGRRRRRHIPAAAACRTLAALSVLPLLTVPPTTARRRLLLAHLRLGAGMKPVTRATVAAIVLARRHVEVGLLLRRCERWAHGQPPSRLHKQGVQQLQPPRYADA